MPNEDKKNGPIRALYRIKLIEWNTPVIVERWWENEDGSISIDFCVRAKVYGNEIEARKVRGYF